MKRVYLHPLPLRFWHWINALLVIPLIATGAYLRLHGIAALRPHDPVLFWHECIGFALVISTVFWFVYNVAGGHLKQHYRIKKRDLKGIRAQSRYYLFSLFKGEENPFRASPDGKYNPLQKTAYGAVMLILLPVQAVTGLLFTDIPVFRHPLLAWNLFGLLDAMHVLVAYLIVLYLVVHLYMATLGETFFSHMKAMIVGYEEQADRGEESPGGAAPAPGVE
jgi:thiosulfate reductase cytochrome b subunit